MQNSHHGWRTLLHLIVLLEHLVHHLLSFLFVTHVRAVRLVLPVGAEAVEVRVGEHVLRHEFFLFVVLDQFLLLFMVLLLLLSLEFLFFLLLFFFPDFFFTHEHLLLMMLSKFCLLLLQISTILLFLLDSVPDGLFFLGPLSLQLLHFLEHLPLSVLL